MAELSHLDELGRARMVNVSEKSDTLRVAVASGRIRLAPATLTEIREGRVPKGDVLAVARVAGIMAAKKTSELIPLCHPLPVSSVDIHFDVESDSIKIEAAVTVTGKTGVEMEALTAVTIAALAVYDMVKAIDRSAVITDVQLESKSGGKSGSFVRS